MHTLKSVAVLSFCLLFMPNGAFGAGPVQIDEGRQPQVAVTSDRVYVTYARDGNVFCAISLDGGKAFGHPVKVAEPKKMPVGMRRGPRIAATKGAVVITAISGEQGAGRDGDVVGWRSEDGGGTWSAIANPISTVPGAAREGLHAMAAGPNGEMMCVWLDLRNRTSGGGTEIWGARSEDGGATWSQDFRIYRSPEKSVCQCCHPSVAYDAGGTSITIMFRNELSGNRDMYVVESRDGGKTFGEAQKLGVGSWELNACPMDGGMVAYPTTAAAGAKQRGPITAWRRADRVFLAAPGEQEQELGKGQQPYVLVDGRVTFTVWISRRPGDLMLARGRDKPRTLATNASDPSIGAAIGARAPVFAVWESGGKVMGMPLADSD